MDVTLVRQAGPRSMPVAGAAITTSAPGTGNAVYKDPTYTTFQLISAAAATCVIEVTDDPATGTGVNSNWMTLGTITLAAAGTDGFAAQAAWAFARARVTVATTPTTVWMGV